ncbi:MAG TPA: LacI family DNA-binding transcriptional regulator [Candidatus Nanopelagicaceae bacterium]
MMAELSQGRARATMQEVAARAGVSLKTVSRVVNREGNVNPQLVDRVLAVVSELGYRPNMQAGFLRRSGGKTKTIGLLLENISNPFSAALHRAIEDVASPRNVIVFAGSLDENVDRERQLTDAFISRRVDGLIIVPTGDDQSYLISEQRAGTPIVFLDRPPNKIEADAVLATNEVGGYEATIHLIRHGHRRIAYLGDYETIYTGAQRLAGYRRAFKDEGIEIDESIILQGFHSPQQAHGSLVHMLRRTDRPTAIFASQNFVTLGTIRALRETKLQYEVALVGFDEIPEADLLDPALTLVTQDVVAMGERAAQILFDRLDGKAGPYETVVIPTTLTPRGSGEISFS